MYRHKRENYCSFGYGNNGNNRGPAGVTGPTGPMGFITSGVNLPNLDQIIDSLNIFKYTDPNTIVGITGLTGNVTGGGYTASGAGAWVEGGGNVASGPYSHAEGLGTQATNVAAHSEGISTIASGEGSHAEGVATRALGTGAHAEGGANIASGMYSHAEGDPSMALGYASHAEGVGCVASDFASHAEGYNNFASAFAAHAEGEGCTADDEATHAEGYNCIAGSFGAHAEGEYSTASGEASHAEGFGCVASDFGCHAEGLSNSASFQGSHAEGQGCVASGGASHAQNADNQAVGFASHAEGMLTYAGGQAAHAEGQNCTAAANYSHAQGYETIASGTYSFVAGNTLIGDVTGVNLFGIYGRAISATGGTAATGAGGPYSIQLAGGTGTATVAGQGIGATIRTVTFGNTPTSAMVASAFTLSNADYAEYFEWADGNTGAEDRVGYFVQLNQNKIELAANTSSTIGIVSGSPGVIGDAAELYWSGAHKTDNYGRVQKVLTYAVSMGPILAEWNLPFISSNPADLTTSINESLANASSAILAKLQAKFTKIISTGRYKTAPTDLSGLTARDYQRMCGNNPGLTTLTQLCEVKLSDLRTALEATSPVYTTLSNPQYNINQSYVPRSQRPEWAAIGLIGKLHVRDDGTCTVGGRCDCANGIAVPGSTWRILERTDTNIIRILYHITS